MKLLKIKIGIIKKEGFFFAVALFLLLILFRYFFIIPEILDAIFYENNSKIQIKNFVTMNAAMSKLSKKEFEEELDLLNKRFPRKEEIPIVLDELEKLGKKLELKIASIDQQKFGVPVIVNAKAGNRPYQFNYQPLLLSINFTCDYMKFAKFLEELDNWHRGIVVVKGFNIQMDKTDPKKLNVADLAIEIPTISDGNE